MTEEEIAEEYNKYVDMRNACYRERNEKNRTISYFTGFDDGAEFGYNKAKKDADKMKSRFLELCNLKDMRIAELKKANEWHYVKDGVYPTHSNRVFVFTDEGVGFGIYGLDNKKWYTYDTGFDVIAWKEIVLPELKEIKEND